MKTPEDLLYAKTHEWVRVEGKEAVIGITHFAQEQLGDITFVDLPAKGAMLLPGKEFGNVESVKAAGDLYAPVKGTVLEINGALESSPELINGDPYGRGWMLRVALEEIGPGLLKAVEYDAHAVS